MKLKTGLLTLATTCALAAAAVTASDPPVVDKSADQAPPPAPPATMSISGVVRDFRAYGTAGGHADFERYSTGHRTGLVRSALDADGKPVLASPTGQNVSREYTDAQSRNINPALFNAELGDIAGVRADATTPAVTSAESFAQWYRDVPGVNCSRVYGITLARQADTGLYVFQAQDDPATPQIEGFFPADGELFNDMNPTYHHNYSFTFEFTANFEYHRGTGQVFTFTGDDDVWVFINGALAIDLGGVHGPTTQTVQLDRIAGLEDGRAYPLKLFFAERHTSGSNCRIETSLTLVPVQLPTTTALYD